MSLDIKHVRDQVTALLVAYPELEDDHELRADMIEGSTSLHDLVSKLLRVIGEMDARSDGLTDYIGKLQARRSRIEQKNDSTRAAIRRIMELADLRTLPLPEATVSLKNGQPKVVVTDEMEIPSEFWRQPPPELDKARIRAALKAHETIPGACLSNPEMTLSIRTL